MGFSSGVFCFFFLPLAVALHSLLKPRNFILLILSLVFYIWAEPGPEFVIFLAVIASNFALGSILQRGGPYAGLVCAAGVLFNLGVMMAFKAYAERMPLAMSFYFLQMTSYLVDVRRQRIPAEKSILDFSVYASMFPHLMAGPILNYSEIQTELKNPRARVSLDDLAAGARRFIAGLGKKVLIADVIAIPVDAFYGSAVPPVMASQAWLIAVLFAFQLYYDFSGYSDMAIGLARMLGFKFPENFNRPYSALGFADFWRRWHITFSRWVREYLFMPLALGLRNWGAAAGAASLLVACIFSGLWHGWAWHFVAWGVFHGTMLALEAGYFGKWLRRRPVIFQRLYFLPLLLIGYAIFRAPHLPFAAAHIRQMFDFSAPLNVPLFPGFDGWTFFAVTLAAAGCIFEGFDFWKDSGRRLDWMRPAWFIAVLVLSLGQIAFRDYSPFIYFQF